MKNYNEISKDLLERRERYLAEKKNRRKKIRNISISICSMFTVVLIVLGVWKGGNFYIIPPAATNGQILNSDDGENITDKNGNCISETKNKTEKENSNGGKAPNKYSNKTTNGNNSISSDDETGIYVDATAKTTKINFKNNGEHGGNRFETEPTTNDEPKYIEKIVVTKMPDKTVYYVGDKFDFTGLQVMGYFTNGVVEDITKYVYFYSYEADAARYSYKIIVEYVDDSESINLACTEFYFVVKAPTVSINESNLNLSVGESRQLSAFTEGTGCDISWYSTDSSVIAVDGNGNVTAVGDGSASVYAVISFKDFTATSNYCQVNVNSSVSE